MGLLDIFRRRISLRDSGVLHGSTDSHCHILPGVDDGIRTMEESLSVLALYDECGVSDVWCTPHIMEDLPNTSLQLRDRFEELKSAYEGPIRLHLAAEYMLDNLFKERIASGDLLMMDEETVLVETSTWNPPPALYETLSDLLRAGYRPLLAHPERYRYMTEKDYEKLHAMGVRFQLNLPSIVGYYGETARKRAEWILRKGWYMKIGSDCHRYPALLKQMECDKLLNGTVDLLSASVNNDKR